MLKTKEQKLLKEIKKRGDLARQLCSAKDDEIKQLREKLHFDQRQHQTQTSHNNNGSWGMVNGESKLQTENNLVNTIDNSKINETNLQTDEIVSNHPEKLSSSSSINSSNY